MLVFHGCCSLYFYNFQNCFGLYYMLENRNVWREQKMESIYFLIFTVVLNYVLSMGFGYDGHEKDQNCLQTIFFNEKWTHFSGMWFILWIAEENLIWILWTNLIGAILTKMWLFCWIPLALKRTKIYIMWSRFDIIWMIC